MPDEPKQHPAADRAMRWLGGNWFVPIISALTLEAVARSNVEVPCKPAPPAIEQPQVEMDMEP